MQCYGKIASAPENVGALWRDGRAAEGACLENMFGSHQRGFESHSLRQTIFDYQSESKTVSLKSSLGRCQSGRLGPPAKRLPGRNPRSQVRILSSPPRKTRSRQRRRARFCSVARPCEKMIFESCAGVPATNNTSIWTCYFLTQTTRREIIWKERLKELISDLASSPGVSP